ncbi:unnamed protein product [Notodromas monacha]|uniref:Uncharacterized protein n=1 Tax=Notodromas monacha TaxID=399045 RepID=A0A7R9BZ00_9CRUS|nr:unnamed protein product [Notodromas monacha]CAG0923146.1 unnamed protein product [Notodromas monacha]
MPRGSRYHVHEFAERFRAAEVGVRAPHKREQRAAPVLRSRVAGISPPTASGRVATSDQRLGSLALPHHLISLLSSTFLIPFGRVTRFRASLMPHTAVFIGTNGRVAGISPPTASGRVATSDQRLGSLALPHHLISLLSSTFLIPFGRVTRFRASLMPHTAVFIGTNGLTSPEIPSGGLGFLHQRTQSMDSVSSGHSSTPSNGVAHPSSGMALSASYADFYSKRRVTVKPLADPDDEEESSYKPLKETPMEREIRLAREREEELRRIRSFQASFQNAPKQEASPVIGDPQTKQIEQEKVSPVLSWDLSGKTEVVSESAYCPRSRMGSKAGCGQRRCKAGTLKRSDSSGFAKTKTKTFRFLSST